MKSKKKPTPITHLPILTHDHQEDDFDIDFDVVSKSVDQVQPDTDRSTVLERVVNEELKRGRWVEQGESEISSQTNVHAALIAMALIGFGGPVGLVSLWIFSWILGRSRFGLGLRIFEAFNKPNIASTTSPISTLDKLSPPHPTEKPAISLPEFIHGIRVADISQDSGPIRIRVPPLTTSDHASDSDSFNIEVAECDGGVCGSEEFDGRFGSFGDWCWRCWWDWGEEG
ncbi:hypothetical protein H0H93_009830 [Arthromyces matolae]|nr:hypothetical protein H0H93_009830 [Arthromyces matolae]